MYIENGRTKQQMPHYYQFYSSFKAEEEGLNIANAVKKLNIPYLIIHGADDPTVDVKEAYHLQKWSKQGRLKVIPDTDHVFGAKHPWDLEELPIKLQQTVDYTFQFAIN